MNALIDTCVIIDALQKRVPFDNAAIRLFNLVANNRCDCYITAKALADIYYIMHRVTHNDTDTRLAINKLTILFHIADTAAQDALDAIFSEISDYEDAMMHATAVRIKADYVVTRNTKDYKHSKIKIVTPDEFVATVDNLQLS